MQADFMTVTEAKDEGIIPEAFHEYFNERCGYCGGEMIINDSCSVMKCGNPRCLRRISSQASDMLHDLGYKGYGVETLTNYCQMVDIESISDFIKRPPLPLNLIEDINQQKLTYPQLVELLHIPNLGSKAYKLFQGCDSVADFLKLWSEASNPSEFIITRSGGPVLAQEATEILQDYLDDLADVTRMITVVTQAKKTILLALTGRMSFNGGCTKDEFIRYLNTVAMPAGVEFRRSDALQSVQFIVADTASSSRKYRIGQQRGNLITSTELYNTVYHLADKKLKEVSNGDI